ncbi:hypothetical protein ACFQY9_02125 [Microvirga aerilata]|uniref:hypothetical protein n=1 Tax=Microvirga aerilata TaxID=670292 RepID=UPI003628A5F5
MKTDTFQTLKNRRAIEGQLRWTWSQPLKSKDPGGRTFGEMPVDRLDTEAIQALVDRKVRIREGEKVHKRTGRSQDVVATVGAAQKNNLIKWVRGVLKLAIKRKLVKVNYAISVEKENIKGGGTGCGQTKCGIEWWKPTPSAPSSA